MKPMLIFWNARGLNQAGKRLKVRNLLRQWKTDIICLQETKLELISNSTVKLVGLSVPRLVPSSF